MPAVPQGRCVFAHPVSFSPCMPQKLKCFSVGRIQLESAFLSILTISAFDCHVSLGQLHFSKVSLRCNLHTVKSICFKCAFHRLLVPCQSCTANPTISSESVSVTSQRPLVPICSHPHLPALPLPTTPKQPASCSLYRLASSDHFM